MAEHDMWKNVEDLENAKEVVAKFERRLSTKVRQQEKLDIMEERDFRRRDLLGKYTVKILYRWNNGKFKDKYLKKLERN